MAWRTRSSRRGFGGSGAPLSWHAHGTRPPAGSVEWWPRGLASRMAMSWRATYGIGTRPRKAPNRIHRTDSIARARSLEGRTVAGCQRRLTIVGPHGGRQITISKRNSSGLSTCRWLRALDLNQRLEPATKPERVPPTADLWVTAPKVAGSDQSDLSQDQTSEATYAPVCVERLEGADGD